MADRIPTFEEMAERREELALHQFVEWFFDRYSPDDPAGKARFHTDLFALVRRVHADAQAPLIKQMSAALALAPPAQIILRDTPANTSGKMSG